MGERRRPSSKLKISRRRIVSSGDYGDFVVSNSRRESFRSCTNNTLESPCQLFPKEVKYPKPHRTKLHQTNKHEQGTQILNSWAFNFLLHFLHLSSSATTTWEVLSQRAPITGGSYLVQVWSRGHYSAGPLNNLKICKIVGCKSIKGRIRISRARPIVDRLATDCSDYGFYACWRKSSCLFPLPKPTFKMLTVNVRK